MRIVEVLARPHLRRQIGHRAGDAPVVLVDRGCDRHHAVFPFAVLVRHQRQAALLQHLGDRADEAGPVLDRIAADGDRAVLAVPGAVEVEIALELAEVRQHRLEIPARGAELLPAVIVGRRAAIGAQPVDARSAAEDARLLVARAPAACRIVLARAAEQRAEAGPGEVRVEIGAARIARQHVGRRGLGGDVLAGLDQQHAVARVLGQPRRQRAAGRAAAEDHEIVHAPAPALSGPRPCAKLTQ